MPYVHPLKVRVRYPETDFANRAVRPDPAGDTLIAEAVICGACVAADGRPRRFTDEEAAVMLGPPKGLVMGEGSESRIV
jgi:hypothetical protein